MQDGRLVWRLHSGRGESGGRCTGTHQRVGVAYSTAVPADSTDRAAPFIVERTRNAHP